MSTQVLVPVWLDAFGLCASVVALCIATYLQFIYKNTVPAKFVVGFTLVGLSMFLITVRPSFLGLDTTLVLRAIGYSIFISLEIYGVFDLMRYYDELE